MRKNELRKLRTLPATKEMMEKAKNPNCKYEIFCRVQNLNGYIKIAIFLPKQMKKNIRTPKYEIFLDVKAEEYITRELDDKGKELRWLTAMVNNLDGIDYWRWYYYNTAKAYLNRDGMNTLNSLKLEKKSNDWRGIQRLSMWQQEQKDKQTVRREKNEQAPWDADMKLIPKVPKSFEE